MKRSLLLLAGCLVFAACATPAETASPVPAATESAAPAEDSVAAVVASAKIEPASVTDVGFTISALVKEVAVQEGDVVSAGDVLVTLDTPDLEFAVIAAEQDFAARSLSAQLQKAERVKYVDPNTRYIRWYAIPNEVYLKAKSKADFSQASLDLARANLAQSSLVAPFDATVVQVNVMPGEIAQVNQLILTLADLNSLQVVTTDLSERDIAEVKIGQAVQVNIEALKITVPGRVIRVSPIAETVGGDVVFPVTIELLERPAGLLWGMSAEVEIVTTE